MNQQPRTSIETSAALDALRLGAKGTHVFVFGPAPRPETPPAASHKSN